MGINEILLPINVEQPVGEPNLDSENYTALDDEVMKIGSLQHSGVNWDIVESQSIIYLKTICKDYKVFGHLAKCLLREAKVEKLNQCLTSFVKFNEAFLLLAYPTPDENTIKSPKSKALKLMLSHFEECLKNEHLQVNRQQQEHILTQLAELTIQFEGNKPLLEAIASLEKLTKRLQSQMVMDNMESTVIEAQSVPSQASMLSDAPVIEEVSFNNHRETKLSYFKVAEHCNHHSPNDCLGYRLRRYAMWYGISMLPPQNADGVTQMTAVDNNRVFDYKEALNGAPSIDLLKKIEKTLETSPFWIEGNFLAANCARTLGYDVVADAIQQTTVKFVNKLEAYKTVKFSNGVPFVSDEVTDWLGTKRDSALIDIPITNQAYQSHTDLTRCYEEKGLAAVLKQIDNDYQLARDVREQFNYRLEKIHYLMREGIYDLCKIELKEIRELARNYAILEWEASFFKQIDNMLSKMEK